MFGAFFLTRTLSGYKLPGELQCTALAAGCNLEVQKLKLSAHQRPFYEEEGIYCAQTDSYVLDAVDAIIVPARNL